MVDIYPVYLKNVSWLYHFITREKNVNAIFTYFCTLLFVQKTICYVQNAPVFQVNINGHDIIIYNEKIEDFYNKKSN